MITKRTYIAKVRANSDSRWVDLTDETNEAVYANDPHTLVVLCERRGYTKENRWLLKTLTEVPYANLDIVFGDD